MQALARRTPSGYPVDRRCCLGSRIYTHWIIRLYGTEGTSCMKLQASCISINFKIGYPMQHCILMKSSLGRRELGGKERENDVLSDGENRPNAELDKIPEQKCIVRSTGKEARENNENAETDGSFSLASKVHRWLSAVEETAKKADIMAQESAELKSELERLMKEILKTRHQLMEKRPPLHPTRISYQRPSPLSVVSITNGIQECCKSNMSEKISGRRAPPPFDLDVDTVLKNLGMNNLWVLQLPSTGEGMPVAMQSAYDIACIDPSKTSSRATDDGTPCRHDTSDICTNEHGVSIDPNRNGARKHSGDRSDNFSEASSKTASKKLSRRSRRPSDKIRSLTLSDGNKTVSDGTRGLH